ncbi:methyltransferase domain-containing protein [Candidatus Marsarchaeota archaeon]|nr:methyltransferase domain-containing protein [Candidatus Marsarchaeota archaeon]
MFLYPRLYRKLKRGPQVILPKDIGTILALSEIDKDSICVDAGTGSGWLAVAMARIARQVYSYDTRQDFIEIAMKNREMLGISNLEFINRDVTKGILQKDVDIVALDMPSSEKALPKVKKALKDGGTVVAYLPHAEQLKRFVSRLIRLGFTDIYSSETIMRDMLVRAEGVRPSTKGIWHTAYLVFAKKPAKYPNPHLRVRGTTSKIDGSSPMQMPSLQRATVEGNR